MDPRDAALEEMRAQVLQSMIEHQIVAQALRAECFIFAGLAITLSLLSFFLWKRNVYLSEACLEQVKRHSAEQSEKDARHGIERRQTDERHSLELQSNGMQYLHAFEGIVSARRRDSGGSSTPR